MKKSFFTLLTCLTISFIHGQTDIETVKETVSKDAIEAHIYFLADDLLKGRETGTPENKIAAAYLANSLRSYGVQPNPVTGTYYQTFELEKVSPPKGILLKMGGEEHKQKVSLGSEKLDFNGEAVFLGYGLEADYKGKDVRKKVIIIKAGSPESGSARAAFGLRNTKKALAQKAGALGIIELVATNASTWGFIEHNFNSSRLQVASEEKKNNNEVPYLWVLDKDNNLASSYEGMGLVATNVEIPASKIEEITTQNVIGVVQGTDPKLKNEYIIYSAHYDHVGIGEPDETGDTIYNGARDNAVGTTTVLSMAENLAKYPTKRSALFIMFTGEEKGLLGSKYYVDNPVIPLNQMVYCFNSDNGGYNDTSLATIVGLDRTTAKADIVNAAASFGLRAIEDPAPEQGLFDRSDNVNFAAVGIPAPTFSMGFSSFDGEVTKYYHRPGDHADSMDYDYLYKFFSAYVLAGRNIGNNPETPVWVAGDKYEPASKKLYGK